MRQCTCNLTKIFGVLIAFNNFFNIFGKRQNLKESIDSNFMSGIRNVIGDAYFKKLAETIPHILMVIDANDYRLQYINHLKPGYTLEDVIGKIVFDFLQPEYIDLYKEKLVEVKDKKNNPVLEIEGHGAGNSELKSWYRTHFTVLEEAQGKTSSIMLLAEDITSQKLKEIESFNKGEKLKAIINNTNDIICSLDLDYNLTEFNETFFNLVKGGYNIEMKIGMSVLQFIDPTKHEHLKSIYKRVENSETVYDIENYNTVSGTMVYNETSFHPIFDNHRKVSGISIFSKDITERVKTESKMKAALREKEVLLSEIHHRIKNNLAIVSSLLQLQELNISNAEAKNALSLSRKRIKSTALIHEMLYRNESFEYINLNQYISELFSNLKINDNIHLDLNGEECKIELTTAMPLGLMLNEIMLNSFKHSYKDACEGKTEIVLRNNNNSLVIDYCDCKGIFPAEIDFNNSNTTGLTLIHTFANQLNGSIELISHSPPKYKIIIPLNEDK